ncbi:MAG TPA: HD domain-containing protein [Candidatus Limnocylindria bacterium]|nr:HD domain-containing protein [Candidatus Limnocylindria bacterium]
MSSQPAPRPTPQPQPQPIDKSAPAKLQRGPTKTRTEPQAKREGPTLDQVREHPRVKAFIRAANEQLGVVGYTEHGERHARTTADSARFILKSLGHDARRCELAAIAAWMHDIGNVITRDRHAQTGALIAAEVLRELHFTEDEVATVMAAVGNHEGEEGGQPVSAVSAAVILADKSDVHRSRVRNPRTTSFDIHDRVNYAATAVNIRVDRREKLITLELTIDTTVSPLMEYFEIFLSRMVLCRRSAEYLHCLFALVINNTRLL